MPATSTVVWLLLRFFLRHAVPVGEQLGCLNCLRLFPKRFNCGKRPNARLLPLPLRDRGGEVRRALGSSGAWELLSVGAAGHTSEESSAPSCPGTGALPLGRSSVVFKVCLSGCLPTLFAFGTTQPPSVRFVCQPGLERSGEVVVPSAVATLHCLVGSGGKL